MNVAITNEVFIPILRLLFQTACLRLPFTGCASTVPINSRTGPFGSRSAFGRNTYKTPANARDAVQRCGLLGTPDLPNSGIKPPIPGLAEAFGTRTADKRGPCGSVRE